MRDFGSIIKELRKKNNLTQARLAELVDYSEKELQRIEQNKHIPSVNLLHQLSRIFNMDLNEYYKRYYSGLSLEATLYFDKFNKIFSNGNYIELPGLIEECQKMDEYKTGENLLIVMLARALCEAHLSNDFNKSINICTDALKKECHNFHIDVIGAQIFSNTAYAIINCLACNYIQLNNMEIALEIYVGLIKSIEHFMFDNEFPLYRSTEFSKRLYQAAINNVSELYFVKEDYKSAKEYSELGISFSVKNNFLKNLPNLYMLKMKSSYHFDQKDEAKEAMEYAFMLYGVLGQENKIIQLREVVQDFCPGLIQYLQSTK